MGCRPSTPPGQDSTWPVCLWRAGHLVVRYLHITEIPNISQVERERESERERARGGGRGGGERERSKSEEINQRLTIINLTDTNNLHRAPLGRPLPRLLPDDTVILGRLDRDVLPPADGDPVAHVGDQHGDVVPGHPRVEHQPLHGQDQVRGLVAPPADVVEAQVQDDKVGPVGGHPRVEEVEVQPRGRTPGGEVGAAAVRGEGRVDGGVVGAPRLGVEGVWVHRGRICVLACGLDAAGGGEGAIIGAYELEGWVVLGVIVVSLAVVRA